MKYYIGNNKRNIQKIICGKDEYPVIITSVGVSEDNVSFKKELYKARKAIASGASIINDNSLAGLIDENHEKFIRELPVPFAIVGINSFAKRINSSIHIPPAEFVKNIIRQIEAGVDIITLHATIFKEDNELIKKTSRIIPCTSRGGLLMLQYMNKYGYDNPYWTCFEDILICAKKNNATLSLCSAFRPASVYDCDTQNDLYWVEIHRISELVKKANAIGVNIMVEGIGHCPIHLIPNVVRETKRICLGAPYRILTVSTDIALGHDHISSAIATAVAVENGADVVTCVTRSEHIGLPSISEIVESIISTKIAIHSGYIARTGDYQRDIAMSNARMKNGCIGEIDAAIDLSNAQKILARHKLYNGTKLCSMCGDNCSLAMLENLSKYTDKK